MKIKTAEEVLREFVKPEWFHGGESGKAIIAAMEAYASQQQPIVRSLSEFETKVLNETFEKGLKSERSVEPISADIEAEVIYVPMTEDEIKNFNPPVTENGEIFTINNEHGFISYAKEVRTHKTAQDIEAEAERYLDEVVTPHCKKHNYDFNTEIYVLGAAKFGYITGRSKTAEQ